MYQKQKQIITVKEGRSHDLEGGPKEEAIKNDVGMDLVSTDGSEIELAEHYSTP